MIFHFSKKELCLQVNLHIWNKQTIFFGFCLLEKCKIIIKVTLSSVLEVIFQPIYRTNPIFLKTYMGNDGKYYKRNNKKQKGTDTVEKNISPYLGKNKRSIKIHRLKMINICKTEFNLILNLYQLKKGMQVADEMVHQEQINMVDKNVDDPLK